MFSKLAIIATASLALFAAAAPTPGAGSSTCSTGNMYCCNTVQNAKDASTSNLLAGLLGAQASGITGMVGIGCVLNILSGCNQQSVCCENNQFDGLVAIGCTPIAVN